MSDSFFRFPTPEERAARKAAHDAEWNRYHITHNGHIYNLNAELKVVNITDAEGNPKYSEYYARTSNNVWNHIRFLPKRIGESCDCAGEVTFEEYVSGEGTIYVAPGAEFDLDQEVYDYFNR